MFNPVTCRDLVIIEGARRNPSEWSLPRRTKAFIADVAADLGTTVEALAPVLLEEMRAGRVELARWDFAHHDPERAAASEVTYMNSTFHFVVVS